MIAPDGAHPPDLCIAGLRLAVPRAFESRDPPRSRSPPPAAPRTPVAPNPWARSSRLPQPRQRPAPSLRLRELRTRFLARKFFALWRRRTFGRASPSAARTLRRKQLLRMAFARWFDLYWAERKEWRLRLRAECHDRLRLWQKGFAAWKAFTLKRRVSRARTDLARAHADALLRQKAWHAWRAEAQRRGRRRRAVLAFRAEWLLRRCLRTWATAAAAQRADREQQDARAKAKAWSLWRVAVQERRNERESARRAEEWRRQALMGKAMCALQNYAGRRRHQRIMKARAERFRGLTVKAAVFVAWRTRLRQALRLRAFEDRMTELSRRCRLRWALLAIRRNVALVREGQVKLATAVLHDERRRQHKAFEALAAFVRARRGAAEMKAQADRHRRKALLLRCLRYWERRIEFEEEKRLEPESVKARKLRRFLLLRAAFSSWRTFLCDRRASSALGLLASRFFASRALPHCFSRWRAFVEVRRRRAAQLSVASEFRRKRLLCEALCTWRQRCEEAAQERFRFRVAVLHDRGVLLRKGLAVWHERTEFLLWEREQLLLAAHFDRSRLLVRHLRLWRLQAADRLREADLEAHANRHCRHTRLRSATRAWRDWAARRARRRRQEEEAKRRKERRTKQAVVSAWRELVRQKSAAASAAARRGRAKDLLFLEHFWPKLRAAIALAKKNRLASEKARSHYRRAQFSKVFLSWRVQAAHRSSRRAEQQRQLLSARLLLSQSLARRVLAVWLARREERLLDRLAMTRARLHHERHLRQKVLRAWSAEVARRQEARLQQDQAAWFDRVRLLGGALRRWHDGLAARHRRRAQEVAAVVHWARQLQRNCLERWRVFVFERRIERARREEAVGRFRARILLDGVRLWLVSSDGIRSERQRQNISANLQESGRGWEAARRCAERWRRKARKSSLPRPRTEVPFAPQRTVLAPPRAPEREVLAPTPRDSKAPTLPPPRVPDFLRESLQRANLLTTPPPEGELRAVCDQLKRFKEDRKRLKSLRMQLKMASGDDLVNLKASVSAARAAVKAVDQNALLDRAKDLVRALSGQS